MAALAACAWLVGCGDDDAFCSVEDGDAGLEIRCSNGTRGVIPRGDLPDGSVACSATPSEDGSAVLLYCGDQPPIRVPIASDMDGGSPDGGCTVVQGEAGIAITCPDGTSAQVPTDSLPPLSSLKIIGATTASCGTCHDSDRARAHFAVMTVNDPEGLPIETCGTCHNETSIQPVSRSHARPEYDPPGLRVQLGAPTIDGASRKITVPMTFSELGGAPVPNRTGMSVSMVISKVENIQSALGTTIAGPYRSLISRSATQQNTPAYPLMDGTPPRMVTQPSAENTTSGRFTEVGAGVWNYTTNYALPADYDQTATYVLSVYATRTVNGVRYVGNATRFFQPGDASSLPPPRNIVNTATCNNCHNPLQAHGGSRQDVQLCLTCHTQGAVDPESGNSIDFDIMIHRIHMGKDLPEVRAGGTYSIVGNALSVHDWSHAGFPQSVANCQSCHTAADSDRWITNGSRSACLSCHQNVLEANMHPVPIQPTTRCGNAICHAPTEEAVGRDAVEAHVTSLNNLVAPVFDVRLVSIEATTESAPVVRFSAYTGTRASGAGSVDGGAPQGTPVTSVSSLSMLEAFVNGPNSGFTRNGNNLVRIPKDQLVNLAPVEGTPGDFTFSLPQPIHQLLNVPAETEGLSAGEQSFTLSLRAQFDPAPGVGPASGRVDMLRNPAMAFSPTATPSPRAPIVSTQLCNKCHGELSAHGGANLAKSVEQCVMCHTGSLDTRVRQGANKQAGTTTSLRFATLVHRIHGGAKAQEPYRVFGFSATPPYPVIDFSELGYPGDARACTTCHLPGTYFLPLPENDPPTRTVSLDENGNVIE